MKYILSFLILLGGCIGVIACAVLFLLFCDKIIDWEWNLSWKYEKYRKFKENVLPWLFITVIGSVFLFCLVCGYFAILGCF